MLLDEPYIFLSFVSGVAVTTLGIVLCLVRIESNEDSRKIRMARLILAASYFILSVPDWLNMSGANDAGDKTAATIVSASIQSLLFTFTLIAMIQPLFITKKRLLANVAAVSIGTAGYLVADSLTDGSPYITCIVVAVVILQLAYYTLMFKLCYKRYIEQVTEYYDDDRKQHLLWARNSFYAALTVGITAILSLIVPAQAYNVFMCCYIAFYVWFASRFINYVTKLNYYLPAVSVPTVEVKNGSPLDVISRDTDFPEDIAEYSNEHKERLAKVLDEYVASKDYLDPEHDRNWLIAQSGTDLRFFRWYFQNIMLTDFRVWRANLRIEEAKRLIETTPGVSMNVLATKLGFGTSQNFYHHFKKVVGMTPTEYQEKTR